MKAFLEEYGLLLVALLLVLCAAVMFLTSGGEEVPFVYTIS